jgi:hypothetical protein
VTSSQPVSNIRETGDNTNENGQKENDVNNNNQTQSDTNKNGQTENNIDNNDAQMEKNGAHREISNPDKDLEQVNFPEDDSDDEIDRLGSEDSVKMIHE